MSDCINKNIGKNIDKYLLDLLSPQDTNLFEQHLLECDFCSAEVDDFSEASSRLLRSKLIQEEVADMVASDVADKQSKTENVSTLKQSRWWSKKVVWVAAALFIILLFKPWKIEIAPDDEVFAGDNRVAILPINISESDDNWLGEAATNLLNTNLSESNQLTILTTQHVKNVLEYLDMEKIKEFDADLAVRVAEKATANWVIIGKIDQIDPELAINVILLNVATGDTVTNKYLSGKATDDLFSIIDKMTDTLKTNILRERDSDQALDQSVANITTRSPQAYRYYLEGVAQFEQLYYQDAKLSFEKAIDHDSTFAMAYYYLASVSDSSFINNALKYIDKSSRREQYYIRASAALFKDDIDGFFNEIEKLINDFPFDARSYYWYARVQNGQRNEQKALDYYYKTIEIDPYHKLTYNAMCYIFIGRGDYEKALWANDMYIAISPDEANPYDTRGDIYSDMGDFENAIESYLKVMEIKPFFSFTYSKLGLLYMLIRNFDQARYWQEAGWANEHGEEPFPANITAYMFAAEGKFEKAIETLDEALPLVEQGIMKSTDEKGIILNKAIILSEKNPNLSIRELEKISKSVDSLTDFQRADYYLMYTRYLNAMGDSQAADNVLEKLKQDIDTMLISQYIYLFIAGDIDFMHKRYDDAILKLKLAADTIGPNHDFDSRYLLAAAYVESGRYKEAVSELTHQLKSNNYRRIQFPIWNAKIHYYLGRAYEGLEKYQLAIKQYEHFLDIWKDTDWKIKELDDAGIRLENINKFL